MITTPRQCCGKECNVHNQILPFVENDSHEICTNCRDQICSIDNHCPHCENWSVEK